MPSSKLNLLPDNPEASLASAGVGPGRFPSWLHRKLPKGHTLWKTGEALTHNRLPTVCEEAKCPNLLECWSRKTATFLVMGSACTRACGFCSIDFAKNPKPLEADEPLRVAAAVRELGLKHVVITMVARDDLPDGGAAHLAAIIQRVRTDNGQVTIEVLTSDLEGNTAAYDTVLAARPEVFNHNIETVRALTPRVRHKATYERSLAALAYARKKGDPTLFVKSGLMVGLGESQEEVFEALHDLKNVGCSAVTIGQYLQPTRQKLLVKAFIPPAQFKVYEEYGKSIGIPQMHCGPFVRSSYHADELLKH